MTTRPAGRRGPGEERPPASAGSGWENRVLIDGGVTRYSAVAERLARAAGVRSDCRIPPGAVYDQIEAAGRVGDVLEAGRLLGRWSWQTQVDPGTGGKMLRLGPAEKGR